VLGPQVSGPAAEEALGALMARHWEAWLDERVPALGGKTPRQAAKTAVGRERLEALLVDFASRSEQEPVHMRVGVDRLRQQLGLPAARGSGH
jgi:hypothetical protein